MSVTFMQHIKWSTRGEHVWVCLSMQGRCTFDSYSCG